MIPQADRISWLHVHLPSSDHPYRFRSRWYFPRGKPCQGCTSRTSPPHAPRLPSQEASWMCTKVFQRVDPVPKRLDFPFLDRFCARPFAVCTNLVSPPSTHLSAPQSLIRLRHQDVNHKHYLGIYVSQASSTTRGRGECSACVNACRGSPIRPLVRDSQSQRRICSFRNTV